MTGDESTSRRPAKFVGGQRRRLARRSGALRSNTMPVLGPESAAASLLGSTNELNATHAEGGGNTLNSHTTIAPLENSQSMLNFYPPTGLPAEALPRNESPASTTASSSSAATKESKRKHGFLEKLKIKDSSRHTPTTPLPPQTPTKAAKLLGVDPSFGAAQRSSGEYYDDDFEELHEEPRVRPVFPPRSSSMPMLTTFEGGGGSRFHEEYDELDPRSPKSSIWSKGGIKNRAAELHELSSPPTRELPQLPPTLAQAGSRRRTRKKDAKLLDRMAPIEEASFDNMSAAFRHGNDDTTLSVIDYYKSDAPFSSSPSLSRNEPVYTTAHLSFELEDDDLSPSDQIVAEDAEEKETMLHPTRKLHRVQRSLREPHTVQRRSPLQRVENRLLDAAEMALQARKNSMAVTNASQLRSNDRHYEMSYATKEDAAPHPGSEVDLNTVEWQDPTPVLTDELQAAGEDRFLDTMEAELEAIKNTLDKSDANRAALDSEVAALKASHDKFKKDFKAMKQSQGSEIQAHSEIKKHTCDGCGQHVDESSQGDSDNDLVSLRSSIDLDEEPTVHVAKAMTITKVTPGMVKLVDIPPRKKRTSHVKDWVNSYDAKEQRPVSERMDADVLRDRQMAPAPLPK